MYSFLEEEREEKDKVQFILLRTGRQQTHYSIRSKIKNCVLA